MPQIKEYESRTDVQGATNQRNMSGDDVGNVGRALQGLGQQVQNSGEIINRRIEQEEVTDTTVKFAEAQSTFTTKLKNDLQTGTLNTEELGKSYDEHVGKFESEISTTAGRQYFKKQNATLRAHLIETGIAGQQELAGVKAVESYKHSVNTLGSALINDPSGLAVAQSAIDTQLDSLVASGSLPVAKATELKGQTKAELTKAAVSGWIELNPTETKERLNKGEWDDSIDGNTKKQLLGQVDNELRSRRVDADYQRAQEERVLKESQKDTQQTILEKIVNGTATTKDIMRSNLDATGGGSKEHFLNLMDQEVKSKSRTEPAIFNDFSSRIHLADGDPNKLTEDEVNRYIGKGISISDATKLRREIQGGNTAEGKARAVMTKSLFKQAEAALVKKNPMTGLADPAGEESLARYRVFVQDQVSEGMKKGIPEANFYDPNKSEYLGKFIGNYQKSLSETINAQTQAMQPRAPVALPDGTIPGQAPVVVQPRLPGEKPDAYLKRIGGK